MSDLGDDTTMSDSEQFDNISSANALEETLLAHEEIRSASPSASSSSHTPYRVNYISHVKDFSSKVETIIPTCQCRERTENIVALMWGAFVLFLGVLFVAAQFNTHLKLYSFTTTYWVLSVFMLISVVAMVIAIQNRKRINFIGIDVIEESDDYTVEGDTRYLIVNTYIFSIGNFLLDMFSILTVFHCGLGGSAHKEIGKYAAKFVYHLFRLIFTAMQLSFLQIFSNEKIRRAFRLPYKLLIVHVIVTNFSIWFSFLCQETGILSKYTYVSEGEYKVLNCTSTENDNVFQIAKNVTIYLTPFVLEFSLLAASMLYSLYPVRNIVNDEPDHRRKFNYGAIDTVKRDNSKIYRSHPALLAGIIIGLLLILSSLTLEDNTHYIYNLRFCYAMQIIVHLFMTLASIMVVREMQRYHTKRYQTLQYRIDDYLLLLTGIGGFLPFLFMVLFAVFKVTDYGQKDFMINGHEGEIRVLLCVLATLNVISVLTQTFVLLNAHSYKRVPFAYKSNDSSADLIDAKDNYTKLRSSARIGQWLIFLLLLNLSMWIFNFHLRIGLWCTYYILRTQCLLE